MALKKVLERFPELISDANKTTFFQNIVWGVTPDNVDSKIALWKEGTKVVSPKQQDQFHLVKHILNNNPGSQKLFDAMAGDLNLLATSTNNLSLLQVLCGEGQPNLAPLTSHLDSVRALGRHKLTKKIEEYSGLLAEIREGGNKRGYYGDDFLKLAQAGTGWISEEGCFIAVPYYNHVQQVAEVIPVDHPVYEWLRPRQEALKEYIDAETDSYFAAVTPGEHPEAHNIEMWADDQESEFREMFGKFITERGWIRVVYDEDNKLQVEGSYDALKKHKGTIELLAELCGSCRKKTKPTEINETIYRGLNTKWSLPANVITPDSNDLAIDV